MIVIEEELILAPDFLYFMQQCLSILDKDPSLLAVSAWNYNGNLSFFTFSCYFQKFQFLPNFHYCSCHGNCKVCEHEMVKLFLLKLRYKGNLRYFPSYINYAYRERLCNVFLSVHVHCSALTIENYVYILLLWCSVFNNMMPFWQNCSKS